MTGMVPGPARNAPDSIGGAGIGTERGHLTLGQLLALPYRGRLAPDGDGWSVRYRALDGSDDHQSEMGGMGRPGPCGLRIGLLPLRDHVAALHRLVQRCWHEGSLPDSVGSGSSWAGVAYMLHMAASLEDLDADTSFVDDTEAMTYCGPVARFEAEHSELASKYMAALVVFNFVWAAYEGAVELAAAGRWPRLKTGAKGREVLAATAPASDSLPFLRECVLTCWRMVRVCDRATPLAVDLDRLLPRLHGPFARTGAEIARAFRNHVAHGDDEVPSPDGPMDRGTKGPIATQRLHTVGRLCLLLIQLLAIEALPDTSTQVTVGDVEGEDVLRPASRAFAHLHVDEAEAEDDEPRLPLEAGWRLMDLPPLDDRGS